MSYIKDNLKLLVALVIVMAIAGVSYYFLSILPPQLQMVQQLQGENEVKKKELQYLEQRLEQLPQTKIALNNLRMEKQALQNKIPHHQMPITMMLELMAYMDAYDFQDTEVLMGEPTKEEEGTSSHNTIPMTIQYTATYDAATKLLEEISRSNQLITVDSFSIDNSVQEQKELESTSTISGDTVEVEMILLLHYIESDNEGMNPNFADFSNRTDNVFLRPSNEGVDEIEQKPSEMSTGLPKEKPSDSTKFEIHLADIFRAGDNYSFSGYSTGKDPVYAGLTSEKDVTITLTVNKDGYTCKIEDADGKQSEQKVTVAVKDPTISINSKTQKVLESMPNAKIRIHNNTPDVIKVNMRGTLLENITIYNENNKIVAPGKQVGKIALNM